jgi:hypothetical protein
MAASRAGWVASDAYRVVKWKINARICRVSCRNKPGVFPVSGRAPNAKNESAALTASGPSNARVRHLACRHGDRSLRGLCDRSCRLSTDGPLTRRSTTSRRSATSRPRRRPRSLRFPDFRLQTRDCTPSRSHRPNQSSLINVLVAAVAILTNRPLGDVATFYVTATKVTWQAIAVEGDVAGWSHGRTCCNGLRNRTVTIGSASERSRATGTPPREQDTIVALSSDSADGFETLEL